MPGWEQAEDGRLFAPSTGRNREAILHHVSRWAPEKGAVLEIASGAGEHAVFFTRHLPNLVWQPSDPDPRHRKSIAAWSAYEQADETRLSQVPLPPLDLDVSAAPESWSAVGPYDAVFSCNLTHISPWSVTLGLMAGAAYVLKPGGAVWLYGPFFRGGKATSEGDARFDASLRADNPALGYRDLDDVHAAAKAEGLHLDEVVQMPANNLFIRYLKSTST